MTDRVTLRVPAKINLTLDVSARRADGYHGIRSVMQQVSLYDVIEASRGGRGGIEVRGCPGIPRGEDNIAYRAAELFFRYTRRPFPVAIAIRKGIPMEAGLAGGSADAAGTLTALNRLAGGALTEAELAALGLELGSDVPFCLAGGAALCEGRGEKLTPLPPLPGCSILLVKPPQGLKTAEVYRRFDELPQTPTNYTDAILPHLRGGCLAAAASALGNALEPAACDLLPCVAEIRREVAAHSPLGACMSGSGSAVFAIFDSLVDAQKCADAVSRLGEAYLCGPVGLENT